MPGRAAGANVLTQIFTTLQPFLELTENGPPERSNPLIHPFIHSITSNFIALCKLCLHSTATQVPVCLIKRAKQQYEQTVQILDSPALISSSFWREKNHFFFLPKKIRSADLHLNKKLTGWLRRCQNRFCREEEQKLILSALQAGRRRLCAKKS